MNITGITLRLAQGMPTMRGDINNDGKVDGEDLRLLRSILDDLKQHEFSHTIISQLTPEQQGMLDITQDGKFTYEDVIALCKLVVKETESHPTLSDKFSALQNKIRHKQ